jgi:SAM-dependent methyltransferase
VRSRLDSVAEARSAAQGARAPRVRALGACPVCRSTSSSEAFVAPDFLLGVPGEYRYVRCRECASVYQDPRVEEEDLPICYSSDYFTHHVSGAEPALRPVRSDSLRGRLRRAILHAADGQTAAGLGRGVRGLGWLLARLPSLRRRARYGLADPLGTAGGEERCLEVGPGRGVDLRQLGRIGWQPHGLEMDPVAAANARAVSGHEVRVGTVLTTDYPPASFQLIYMSHVLEHLPQLERSLTRCLELLAPGGRLFAAYPNPSALTTRFHGRHSCVWDPPRHLTLPTKGAVLGLLRRVGFVRTRAWTSAMRAEAYRGASARHARGERGFGTGGPNPIDRLFAALERVMVMAGANVGEEILVVGHRPGPK